MKCQIGMKVGFLFFAVSIASSCVYHDLPNSINLGVTLSLYQSDSVLIRDLQQTAFVVKVLTISDSRCPAGLYCIWGGEASVRFEIGSNDFSLKISESKQFMIDQKEFQVKLLNVLPFPTAQNLDIRKQAVFIVDRI